ncbi:autotransporter outer membrane beta-barrel domain-containing protein [Lysobacter soli]|uniref:autotransporter outer membrane beta-barrel domain-containing protein n=1 Tax=Lysobacter soli TaxID=453783 RepID=UPI0024105C1E|nr:autotransporter outer membrane beta-barrel domain-containing protein [Lysobacter soli]MDG2516491.1 autotransporter outer membrane beta-barrel domain-containing protein [Lysobacter soli]
MKFHSPKQRPLVLALYLAITVAAPVSSQATSLTAIGEDLQASNQSFDTGVQTGIDGIALLATAGELAPGTVTTGSITGSGVNARSAGDQTMTALAYTGGTIDLSNSKVRASGNGSIAVAAADGGLVRLSGGSVTSTGAAFAAGLMADAGTIEASNVAILASGTGTNDAPIAGAIVQDGGRLDLDGGSVSTLGNYAHGVWAQDADTLVQISGTEISTAGATALGVLAVGNAQVAIRDASVETEGFSANAIGIGSGATIEAENTTIGTSGESGLGVFATGNGSTAVIGNSTITTSGDRANGIVADDAARVSVDDSEVTTSAYLADAVVAANSATIAAQGATIATSGEDAYGVLAYGAGSARLVDSAVSTQGKSSFGVSALDPESRIEVTGGSVATTGERANALDAYLGGNVTAQDVRVATTGAGAVGVSAFGAGSRIDVVGGTVTTDGVSAAAVSASTAGRVTIRDSSVATHGENSDGLSAWRPGSIVEGDNVEVVVSGNGDATGAAALSGGTVRVRNSRIENEGTSPYNHAAVAATADADYPGAVFEATDSTLVSAHGAGVALSGGASAILTNTMVEAGRNAIGFEAAPSPLDAEATIVVTGGALHSADATVGAVSGKGTVTLADGVQIANGNGTLAQVNPDAALTLNLDDVQTAGNLAALAGGVLDFNLRNGSSLSGTAFNANNAALDATSLWTLTGNSVVASMHNGGTIAFTAPAGGAFKQLVVDGNYTGDAGRLALNTVLGGDSSTTDKLVVHGDTAGSTDVTINNVGGTGARTANGIQVVQVDGASNGTFTLAGRASAGAYEYLLYKGGVATPADGDWYLRSALRTDPTPTAPDPAETGGPAPVAPVVPAAPLYRPEPAAYLANQAASVGMFEHSMHDRMGEANLGQRGDDDRTSAAWARVVRNQMDGTTGEGQLDAGTDVSVLQIGGEIARWNDDSRFHVGVMGGTGRADTDVTSSLLDWRSKGKVIGYNLGVYGTWFANATSATGLYLDGWLQYGRYDNKVQGDYLAEEHYNASTWAASMEAGYAFALNDDGKTRFFIEPQAQAIFTDYSASQHRESNGTRVDDVEAGGLTTRVGVRFYAHAANAQQNVVQPFVTLNWWHDNDRNAMSFNDTTLELQWPRDRYETKLGLQAQLGGGWMGWGNLGLVYGARDYRDVTGQLGLNYRW